MPNAGRTQKGSSLRRRIDTAARLTAQDQRARKERARSSRERSAGDEPTRSRSGTGSRRSSTATADAPKSTRSSKRSNTGSSRARAESASGGARRNSEPRGRARETGAAAVSTRSSSRAFELVGKVLPKTLKARILTGVIAFVVIAVVLLYPVGQTYYQSMRELQLNEARLAAEEHYNDAVGKKNEELKTDEGIEAEAREQLGLVKEGEQAAIVTNKDGSAIEGSDATESQLPEQVDLDAVEPPHTWYYDILDVLFFVHLD